MLKLQLPSVFTGLSVRAQQRSKAFTLVELLVVISIIGILIGLLFPALSAVRQAARKSYCSANMRQIILATLSYESTHLSFPAGDNGKGGGYLISLLPYFKQEYLVQLEASDLGSGETYLDRMVEMTELEVEVLICPSSYTTDSQTSIDGTGDYTTHYYGVAGPTNTGNSPEPPLPHYTYKELSLTNSAVGVNGSIGLQGLFSPDRTGKFSARKLNDIRDGASYTFGIGEVSGYQKELDIPKAGWAFGAEYNSAGMVSRNYSLKSLSYPINSYAGLKASPDIINDNCFSSNHPGGAQFAFIDGAIRFVDDKVPARVLRLFCSIDEVEKPEKLDEF